MIMDNRYNNVSVDSRVDRKIKEINKEINLHSTPRYLARFSQNSIDIHLNSPMTQVALGKTEKLDVVVTLDINGH